MCLTKTLVYEALWRFQVATILTASIDVGDNVFGDESDANIRYRTLSWPMVATLMIAEIVSNGMLSLPSAIAVVGIVPGVIIITFLGML